MSPEILTLVAAVLVYDLAYDSVLASCNRALLSWPSLSRNARSDTRDEKDMVSSSVQSFREFLDQSSKCSLEVFEQWQILYGVRCCDEMWRR